jgi:hypothetical protein
MVQGADVAEATITQLAARIPLQLPPDVASGRIAGSKIIQATLS